MFESHEANRAYYNHVLDHFHLPAMTPGQLTYVHMHTVDESLAHLIRDEATRNTAQTYRKQLGYLPFLKFMQMEPGLVPLLETLRPHFKTAVATNRTDTMAHVLASNHIDQLHSANAVMLPTAMSAPSAASGARSDHSRVAKPVAVVQVARAHAIHVARRGAWPAQAVPWK